MIEKPRSTYCPVCGTEIVPDPYKVGGSPQIYCCIEHKRKANFAKWYAQNKHRHIEKVMARRKEKASR